MKIFKKIIKILVYILVVIVGIILVIFIYANFPASERQNKASLGITFSYRYAGEIGLDWREAYLDILDDLGVKKVRLPVYWDNVEESQGEYNFSKIDWQLEEARKRGVEIILVVGQKVPRWPECFIPSWVENDEMRKIELLKFIEKTVERYKNNETVKYWQVENEPFLKFGICPEIDANLLDTEIALVRRLDKSKKIMVTDSGELSLWLQAAKRADVFGTTMYREVVTEEYGQWKYPIGPRFFHLKKGLISILENQNNAVVIELQAEPWIAGWTTSFPLSDQFQSMNEEKLQDNVQFAKDADFSEIYLWGAEWWYWLKTQQNYPGLWQEAKTIFKANQ